MSAFFGKEKKICWEIMKSNPNFVNAFERLASEWEADDEIKTNIEWYDCKLHGSRKKIVNDVRYELFNKKYARENEVIDLSLIPPCQSTLMLHLRRSNYVASIWKKSLLARFDLPDVHNHGWNQDYTIKWIEKTFPDNINELLLQGGGGK